MWFAEHEGHRVARVTSGGVVTEYDLPRDSSPYNLVSGPGGRIWVTFGFAKKVVSFRPPLAPVVRAAVPFNWTDEGGFVSLHPSSRDRDTGRRHRCG